MAEPTLEELNSMHWKEIWEAIAARSTLAKAEPVLWDFLRRSPGEGKLLSRFHCAAALFKLRGKPDPDCQDALRRRVQWDHDGEKVRQEALRELWEIMQEEIDMRNASAS